MKKPPVLLTSPLVFALSNLYCQEPKQNSTRRKFYVGSTFFMFEDFIPDDPNPPDFVQLNFSYRISPKNVITIEARTCKYAWPLGIPYWKSKTAPEEKYSGYVREFGIGLVKQHFWWKGAYSSIDAGNMLLKYMDEDNKHIQNS